jgi:hypothetical protein
LLSAIEKIEGREWWVGTKSPGLAVDFRFSRAGFLCCVVVGAAVDFC